MLHPGDVVCVIGEPAAVEALAGARPSVDIGRSDLRQTCEYDLRACPGEDVAAIRRAARQDPEQHQGAKHDTSLT
jgi:hypothetical protein